MVHACTRSSATRPPRAAVCHAARDAIFSGALSHGARSGWPAASGGGRARHPRWRARHRLACRRRAANKPVVLYFHGNGGSLRCASIAFRVLIARRQRPPRAELPRLWRLDRTADREGLIADARAAYAFAAARYPAERIVLWGESLGTGVAVALAAEKPVGRSSWNAPFTSAADVGARPIGSCRCGC